MKLVMKMGGSILGEGVNASILDDIKATINSREMIIVHGGGKEVTEIAEKLGKKQVFVVSPEGIRSRYTDKETASLYTMVMVGKINKEIVSSLQRTGVPAVGLSGVDGGILRAERKKKLIVVDERGRKKVVDGGYTGKINNVNSELLLSMIKNGYLPVISPVALSEEYDFLNVDGDRAAAYVAGSIKADVTIFLTDVKGVLMNDQTVPNLTVSRAKALLPQISFGMEKKILASIEAINMGVKECIIASGLVKNPISSALNHDECTVIYPG
jgi:acetylglutamate/LysW-gamma-L-alpha-aminoadipate kinase